MNKTAINNTGSNRPDANPYPGLRPFEENQKDIFFGRDQEIKDLTCCIEKNMLTVVYGKSGMGKTSLLKAGIFPWVLRQYYLPIYLRITFNDSAKTPLSQAKEIIEKKLNPSGEPEPTTFGENVSLWQYFTSPAITDSIITPLLIFDQFEEIFHTGSKYETHVDSFVIEIADLIENRIPEELRGGNHTKINSSGPNVRVVFSLREEYMGKLETLCPFIPKAKENRFYVSYMKGKDAIDAIVKPARECGIPIEDKVAKMILNKIPHSEGAPYQPFNPKDESWQRKRIEPFILAVFCYQVDRERNDRGFKEISTELVEKINREDVVKNFYIQATKAFKPHVKRALEDLLVTKEGFRSFPDIQTFKDRGKISKREIDKLVEARLVRKEKRGKTEHVELTHDVLAPILMKNREKRKQSARQKKIFLITAMAVTLILTLLIWQYLEQKEKAQSEQKKAISQQKKANEAIAEANLEQRKAKSKEWAAYSLITPTNELGLCYYLAKYAFIFDNNALLAHQALMRVFYEGKIYEKKNEISITDKIKQDKGTLLSASFSPNGRHILAIYRKEAVLLRNWKGGIANNIAKSNAKQDLINLGFSSPISFSPCNRYVAILASDGSKLMFWDIQEPEQIKIHKFDPGIAYMVFSPNQQTPRLLTLSGEKNIGLYNYDFELKDPLQKEVHILDATNRGSKPIVHKILFSRDGNTIASLHNKGLILLWRIEQKGQEKQQFINYREFNIEKDPNSQGGSMHETCADFSPDGQTMVIGTASGDVVLWDIAKENPIKIRTLTTHGQRVISVAFSPDGRYILSVGKAGLLRMETSNGYLVYEFDDVIKKVKNATFSPDSNYILAVTKSNTAHLLPFKQGIIDSIEKLAKKPKKERPNIETLTETQREIYGIPKDLQ